MRGAADLKIVIVGAGFGGIAAAIELQNHGFADITLLERAPELGGTWFYNDYPGAACDVPSQFYSFSFAQRRDWSRLCPRQEDILVYLRDVAREHGVDRRVVTGTTVTRCAWSDEEARWRVEAEDGRVFDADALLLATGQLHQPALPRIEGMDSFAGHSFHSARWDHDYPMAGKRVAVVGTGASAVQFVPEVAEAAAHTTVFQRTGNWFMPRKNRPYPAAVKTVVRTVPGLQAARRAFWFHYCEALTYAIRHPRTFGRVVSVASAAFMRFQLKDPEVRRKVWPDYTFGCKRILFGSYFLPALQRDDVDLVTDAIAAVTPDGIRDAAGTLHPADCIIWGTGFRTTEFMFPMDVLGSGGRDLREAWADGAHAHLGMTVPDFPNLFVLYGPNTNTSGGSIITYLEAQAGYVRQALELLRARGGGALSVRREVEAASDRALQAEFAGTAWTRCDSWYRTADGRIVANWPLFMRDYLQRTARLDPAEFDHAPRPGRVEVAA